MIRVVLDTNILISALLQPQGLPARTFVMVLAGTTAQLCVSGDVYAEYEEVIRRPKFNRSEMIIDHALRAIRQNGFWVKPPNFDASKNVQFKSYAQFRIRGAILDSLRALDWGSRPLRRKGRSVAESISKLSNKLGRQPTEEEIAFDLEMEVSELQKLLRRLDGLHLVGQMVGSRFDDSETQDLIENAPAAEDENPFEICLRSERSEYLTQAVKTLSEKEQLVISLYYREELTMREIATVMDLAESRVSQIHSLAITKLRTAIQDMQLEEQTFR